MKQLPTQLSSFSDRQLDSILLELMNTCDNAVAEFQVKNVDCDALIERAKLRGVHVVIANKLRQFSGIRQGPLVEMALIAHMATFRDAVLAQAVVDITRVFQDSGITCIFQKGPVLWRNLQADSPLKTSADVDVVIRKEEIEKANSALNGMGYWCRELKGSEATYVSKGKPDIDLHWGILTVSTWAEQLQAFMSNAWKRLGSVDIKGVSVPTFSPTDTVLALALHAGCHHICMRWMQIYEIALCTVVLREYIDWDYILYAAGKARLKDALFCPLNLAHEKFGALVPEEILDPASLPIIKRGLTLITRAAFEGKIYTRPRYRVARTLYNLALHSSPGNLLAWAKKWATHQRSKHMRVDMLNRTIR